MLRKHLCVGVQGVIRIRLADDAPEQVQNGEKYGDSNNLPYAFWQVLFGVVDLAAGYRGLVLVDVGSEGAVVRGRSGEER